MPCRHVRVASQALDHIWISDDTLAQAFNRFLRVSHVHRRHGSNVPGPLEARRRSAKRRMGMGAIAAGGGPPPAFDLGALFGLGSAKPTPDFEKEWKWRPPLYIPTDHARPQNVPSGSDLDARERDILVHPENGMSPVETSKSTFESMLLQLADRPSIEEHDILPLVDFLDSSANEKKANLTLRLGQWLRQREEWRVEIWRHLARSITARATHDDIHAEEVASLLDIVLCSDRARALWELFAEAPPVFARVYPTLVRRYLKADIEKGLQKQKIRTLLSVAQPPAYFNPFMKRRAGEWHRVYRLLSPKFRPSDFPEHFANMSKTRFAWILFNHWVPQGKGLNPSLLDDETTSSMTRAVRFVELTAQQPPGEYEPFQDNRSLSGAEWLSYYKAFWAVQQKPDQGIRTHTLMVRHLARAGIQYEHILEDIFNVFMISQDSWNNMSLFMDLLDTDEVVISVHLGVKLVRHFLALNHISYALAVFRLVPGIPLRKFLDLPIKLIEEGHLSPFTRSPRKFWAVVNRSTMDDYVPPEARLDCGNHLLNDLRPEIVDMLHEAAYAWASSPQISARSAFRRVWEAYNFLRSRHAPVSSLMSRAMVRAGILRAVEENQRLSKEQVRYVISLVRKIEGEEAAAELDRMVFDYWQAAKAKHGYSPGKPEDQEGRYGPIKRQIWAAGNRRPGSQNHSNHDERIPSQKPEITNSEGSAAELRLVDPYTFEAAKADEQPTAQEASTIVIDGPANVRRHDEDSKMFVSPICDSTDDVVQHHEEAITDTPTGSLLEVPDVHGGQSMQVVSADRGRQELLVTKHSPSRAIVDLPNKEAVYDAVCGSISCVQTDRDEGIAQSTDNPTVSKIRRHKSYPSERKAVQNAAAVRRSIIQRPTRTMIKGYNPTGRDGTAYTSRTNRHTTHEDAYSAIFTPMTSDQVQAGDGHKVTYFADSSRCTAATSQPRQRAPYVTHIETGYTNRSMNVAPLRQQRLHLGWRVG